MSPSPEQIAFIVRMHALGATKVSLGGIVVEFVLKDDPQPKGLDALPEPELTPEQRKAQTEELIYGSSL